MKAEEERYTYIDFTIDLFKLPFWIWRRICPVDGILIQARYYPDENGKMMDKMLIESKDGKRRWINCEAVSPCNRVGKTVKRCFWGRMYFENAFKRIYIEETLPFS